jgi:hypothetical protein
MINFYQAEHEAAVKMSVHTAATSRIASKQTAVMWSSRSESDLQAHDGAY